MVRRVRRLSSETRDKFGTDQSMTRIRRFAYCVVLLALPPTAALGQDVKQSEKEIVETIVERIEPASVRAEAGFCYTAVLHQGRPGDSEGGPGSECVLLEDGKPLRTAHAVHADIRARGRGAYSHWTAAVLYFSASDNSDPRKNGRAYTLVSRFRGLRRTAVVTVTTPSASYEVRSPGKNAVNRRLTLRNLDPRVAVMPHLRERGSPDLSSREGMTRAVLGPGMTPEQTSIAVWKFLVDRTYHYWPAQDDAEVHDPVKFVNVYGYGLCDDAAQNFAALCEAAGLKARVWGLNGHVVAESFYDGAWHMFDPDMGCYFRGAGGRILGVEDLAKDPSAITATPYTPAGYATAEVAKFYTTTADNGVWPREEITPGHRIEPVLEPRDELTFDFGPARLVHNVFAPDQPPPPRAANGTLTRTLKLPPDGAARLVPVVWPYVILGGGLALDDGPGARRADQRRRRGLDAARDSGRRLPAEGGLHPLVRREEGRPLQLFPPHPRRSRGGEVDRALPVRTARPAGGPARDDDLRPHPLSGGRTLPERLEGRRSHPRVGRAPRGSEMRNQRP